jgi:hypothetical protein
MRPPVGANAGQGSWHHHVVSAELEERLRGAIAAFADAWRDEVGQRPFEVLDPASPDRLASAPW